MLSALAAGGFAFAVHSPLPDKQPIGSPSEAGWLKAILLAYCFGTLLVPFGLANIREPVGRTLKIWAVMLIAALLVWTGPLILAPRFGWTNDGCFNASLVVVLLPTFLDGFAIAKRKRQIE